LGGGGDLFETPATAIAIAILPTIMTTNPGSRISARSTPMVRSKLERT
jgi:hypothetical protein